MRAEKGAEKENYLQVTFDRARGLKLSWNFQDLSAREKYFRHLLVLCSPHEAETHSLLQQFYDRMKQGDILACLYLHSFYGTAMAPWFQKTKLQSLRPAVYLRGLLARSPDARDLAALLKRAQEEAGQFEEAVCVCFLLGGGEQELKLCSAIEQAVSCGSFAYSVSVFGAFKEPRLSYHRAVSRFPLGQDHNQDLSMQLYHTFLNSAVLRRVHLSIKSVGGWLGVDPRSIWRTADFDRIETEFIGPAAMYDCDQLYFWKDGETGEEYELTISLEVQLFSGKKWKTDKRCRITPSGDREHCPTLQPHRAAPYVLNKHVTLSQNPFHSLTIVRHTSSVSGLHSLV